MEDYNITLQVCLILEDREMNAFFVLSKKMNALMKYISESEYFFRLRVSNALHLNMEDSPKIEWKKTYHHIRSLRSCYTDEEILASLACTLGYVDIMRDLLSSGKNVEWNTYFLLACKKNQVEVVRILLQDERINPSIYNDIALKSACRDERIEIVRILLEDDRVAVGTRCIKLVRPATDNYPIIMDDGRDDHPIVIDEGISFRSILLGSAILISCFLLIRKNAV